MSIPDRPRPSRREAVQGVFFTNASRANAYMMGRTRLEGGAGVGIQYGGNRDIYTAAGYKSLVTFADVLSAEEREHIASRIISIFPEYTWRETPEMIDGPDPEGSRETEFCQAFTRVWRSGSMTEDGDTRIGLDYHLPELDRVAGLGKYAVLFLGFAGEDDLSQPITKGQFLSLGVNGLAYAQVFGEGNVTVSQWDSDPGSRRFGKPVMYSLSSNREGVKTSLTGVHWSRVIHVALNGIADLVEGRSTLTPVYNLLSDILKIVAGTGESGYRNADPGMVIKTQPAFEGPDVGSDLDALLGTGAQADQDWYEVTKGAVQDYIHGLERFMILEGYEVDVLTGDVPDPRGPVSTLIDLISGATGIPQRMLVGSEAGELASSQDQENWSSKIEARQMRVAEPQILRPTVNRLVWAGVLPEPQDAANEYSVFWPSLYSTSPIEEAQVAKTVAEALNAVGATVDPKIFASVYLRDLDPNAIIEGANLDEIPTEDEFGSTEDPNATEEEDPNRDGSGEENSNPFTNLGVYP